MKKLTTREFISRSQKIHNNVYDYSKSEYTGKDNKVIIICSIHGEFSQTPHNHYKPQGCPVCGHDKCIISQTSNTDQFIKKANKVHNSKYDYSLVKYKRTHLKVEIVCKKHGVFIQTPANHLFGQGCTDCGNESIRDKYLFTTKDFIGISKKIHGNRYDYSNSLYTMARNNISITCVKHGVFSQNAYAHMNGCGCPSCKHSFGEIRVSNILDKYEIRYKTQSRLKRLKKRPLRFDFYIKEHNLYIEYQGEQHYRSVKHWGGDSNFKKVQDRDQYKREWCKENNHRLLEIKYTDFDNIEEILKKELNL